MFKVLLVTYDLHKPSQEYARFYEIIKSAKNWWHYLESTWLILTDESPDHWANKLRPAMDRDDFLLVIEVRRNYQGWLSEKAWNWINQNVPF